MKPILAAVDSSGITSVTTNPNNAGFYTEKSDSLGGTAIFVPNVESFMQV